MEKYEYNDLESRLSTVKGFSDLTPQEELDALVTRMRPHLRNVIGVTIGKGGVGKTTLAANLAYTLAEEQDRRSSAGKSPRPILYIELDSNGNSRNDFGIRGGEFDDNGISFYDAVTDDRPLSIVKNVRPFLDVVPSGASNADISGRVDKVSAEHGPAAFLLLALLLVQISHLYQWIIIDFSPSDKNNQRLGLAASTHLVAPVKGSDDGVLEGLGSLARLVRGVRVINPEVSIAAIGFLGFKKVKGEPTSELVNLREKIELLVANARLDPEVVISAYVREAPVLAALCRNTGMPAKELALAASGKLADPNTGVLVPRPRDENDRLVEPQRATDLADDYTHFAAAVLHQIRRRNKQLRGEA